MKKISVLLIAGLMASAAMADITGYKWSGGSATDGVVSGDYVISILDADGGAVDMWSSISGTSIDIADLNLFTAFNSSVAAVAPFGPSAGQWATDNIFSTDNSAAGQYVYALVSDYATIAELSVGDTFLITELAGPIAAGTDPASTPSVFSPGTTTAITVVPEPATVGLFGLGALGAWLIRRNKMKAIEA